MLSLNLLISHHVPIQSPGSIPMFRNAQVNSAKLRGPEAGLCLPKHHLLMHRELFLIVFLQKVLQRSLRKQRCLLYFGLQNLSCYIIYYHIIYICPISSGATNGEKYITDHRQLQASPFSNSTVSIQASQSCNLPKKGEKNMLVSWPQSPLPDSQDPPKGWTCWRIWAPLLACLGHGIDHGHT